MYCGFSWVRVDWDSFSMPELWGADGLFLNKD